MTNKKLPSFIALSISLELVLSPLPALADNNTAGKIIQAIGVGSQIYDTVRGAPQGAPTAMAPHVATDMAALAKQQTPIDDKFFKLDKLRAIPGLQEYMNSQNALNARNANGKPFPVLTMESLACKTLPSTLFEAKNEVCRMGEVDMLNGIPPASQAQEAMAYWNQYDQIVKQYDNNTVNSNAGGQLYGTGCMRDAMKVLKGFFDSRREQLGTMLTEMKAAHDKMVKESEMDLKAIEESTAILNGENSKFATAFKDTDIFDYGKRFNNPACNSILANNDMDKMGKEGGLVAIEKRLKGDLDTVPPGSKYSLKDYSRHHASVVNEIKKLANDVSDRVKLEFAGIANDNNAYSGFLEGLSSSVSSDSGVHAGLNKSFFTGLQTKFGQERKKLTDQISVIRSELGGKGGAALASLTDVDNDASFDAELTSLENEIKGECVNRSGIDTALSRIYDPTLSKEANKHSALQIKKRIKAIIADVKLSPEKKMAELQAIENSGGARYEMKMDADYETQEVDKTGKLIKKKVNAASKVTPVGFFTDVIKNCESQYQVNKLNNKLSAKEAIKQLRSLKRDYQKLARQHSKDIKDEIVKKMVDCNGNGATQSSTVEASCSPAKLNMESPNFCAKAAFSCSKNMQQCTEKAQKFVKELKDDRLKRVSNYNNNMEANRRHLVGMFDKALSKYMVEAEALRAAFGANFPGHIDVQRDVKDGSQFDKRFLSEKGDALELKDPERYFEMIKQNVTNLQAAIDQQQKEIIGEGDPNGNGGALGKHIAETEKNYKDKIIRPATQLRDKCHAAYTKYKAMVAQQKNEYDKAQGEMGEKNGELCGRYARIMSDNPNGACKQDISTLADSAIKASAKAGRNNYSEAIAMVEEAEARCQNLDVEADDAETICLMEDRRAFDEVFNSRYTPPSTATGIDRKEYATLACKAVTSGEANDLCIKPAAKDMVVDGDGIEPEGYTCNSYRQVGTKEKTWKASCTSKTKDCSKLNTIIVAIYKNAAKSGGLASNTQTNRVPSFCPGSNNIGHNTKGMTDFLQEALGGKKTAGDTSKTRVE